MAQGQNAQKNGYNREYWSRRPFSGIGWGKSLKVACHRKERRVEAKRDVTVRLDDA